MLREFFETLFLPVADILVLDLSFTSYSLCK